MIKYERAPQLDKRIARGDDFAGDAFVRYVAPGHTPNDEEGDRLRTLNAELVAALVHLEQAYSNPHSPQHRSAARMEARAALSKAEQAKERT